MLTAQEYGQALPSRFFNQNLNVPRRTGSFCFSGITGRTRNLPLASRIDQQYGYQKNKTIENYTFLVLPTVICHKGYFVPLSTKDSRFITKKFQNPDLTKKSGNAVTDLSGLFIPSRKTVLKGESKLNTN